MGNLKKHNRASIDPKSWERMIDDYLNGKLPAEKMDEFEEAYFNNDALLKEVKFRRDLKYFLKEKNDELFPDYTQSSPGKRPNIHQLSPEAKTSWLGRWNRSWIYSAAAVFVLLVSFSFMLIPLGQDKYSDINFQPSPYYQDRIENQYRSSYDIQIFSPAKNAILEKEILFYWNIKKVDAQTRKNASPSLTDDLSFSSDQTALADKKLYLKILNNREELILMDSTTKDQYILNRTLSPGLYYWMLETDEETIYIGSFRITPSKTDEEKN